MTDNLLTMTMGEWIALLTGVGTVIVWPTLLIFTIAESIKTDTKGLPPSKSKTPLIIFWVILLTATLALIVTAVTLKLNPPIPAPVPARSRATRIINGIPQ